jgi:hypothetical protein
MTISMTDSLSDVIMTSKVKRPSNYRQILKSGISMLSVQEAISMSPASFLRLRGVGTKTRSYIQNVLFDRGVSLCNLKPTKLKNLIINGVCANDLAHLLSPRSGASLMYCRGAIVGFASACQMLGFDVSSSMTLIRNAIRPGYRMTAIPDPWIRLFGIQGDMAYVQIAQDELRALKNKPDCKIEFADFAKALDASVGTRCKAANEALIVLVIEASMLAT